MQDFANIFRRISEMGFFDYMAKYPINPISIILATIVIGVVVFALVSRSKKRKADAQLAQNPAAATMIFRTTNMVLDDASADNISVLKLNGEEAHWFFAKPTVPAVYLTPGSNTLELYAHWARNKGFKQYKTEPVVLTLTAEPGCRYTLEYHIASQRYLFEQTA
jgi:hypothetical protein